nr:MAG TPA: hypothetical protein [Bacteriophage sp.]
MSEKTMFDDATNKIRRAFDLLAEADKTLTSLGVDVCFMQYSHHFCRDGQVHLMSGLPRISVLSEKPIENGQPYPDSGMIDLYGCGFTQTKLPVDREDRWA